ncbi:MAG TPA: hypothetical protein VJ837_06030, partial [Candidatus Paceibacterota bacterium]|nr:hypothetical protein [Candidatus Paceibacterota bacterium]
LSFLSSPIGLADAVQTGPIRRQADGLIALLRDPKRTHAHLVTLAEEMPVSETLETATALDAEVKIAHGVVFANAVFDYSLQADEVASITSRAEGLKARAKDVGIDLDDEDIGALRGYAHWLAARCEIQRRHLDNLDKGLAQPIVKLPYLFSSGLALPDVELLADAIEERIEEL